MRKHVVRCLYVRVLYGIYSYVFVLLMTSKKRTLRYSSIENTHFIFESLWGWSISLYVVRDGGRIGVIRYLFFSIRMFHLLTYSLFLRPSGVFEKKNLFFFLEKRLRIGFVFFVRTILFSNILTFSNRRKRQLNIIA